MSVVGIDFGSYSCFVAVARQGGIETIANEYSDRCTPAFVSLNERNRSMGVSAKQQANTNIKNTVFNFKSFIGRKFKDPQVQHEKGFLPYSVVEGPEGSVGIQVFYMLEKHIFTPEQISAMLLTKLKETAEMALKTKVVDITISVPCYFTDTQRRNVFEACQMAGLNCLKVMNDTTAVALAYGIYKQDLPAENEKPRTVVFVDMGHTTLQVSACAFNKGKLKMLAVATNPSLGGRDFDRVLESHFMDDFKVRYKLDATKNPKAIMRLQQEVERIKKLMSANSENIPLNVECFMDDKDVTGRLKRATFEEMSSHIIVEAEKTIRSILDHAKLRLDDIHSVEVIGGSSRIPMVKNLVTEVFQKEPSTTLNADEAVSRGCALQCAILSPTFRVRDFSIMDCQLYPITLSWQSGLEEDSEMEVFSRFHQIPFSKMLTFYRKEPFQLDSRYSNPEDIPYPTTSIGSFKVTKVVPQANGESSKVKVKIRVNLHGIFTVSSATLVERLDDKTNQVDEEAEEAKENATEMDDDSAKQAGEGDQTPNDASAGAERTPATPNGETNMKTDQESPQSPEMETTEKKGEGDNKNDEVTATTPVKKKKTVRSIDLPIENMVPQLSRTELNLFIEKENQMIMQDRLEKERVDSKNAVEEYVYDMREKLYGEYEQFTQEKERGDLSKLLTDTEDWLYDEGEDQMKQVYIDKLRELEIFGQPIADRFREGWQRPQAFDEFGSSLQQVRKALDLIEQADERYSHLESKDIEVVMKCLQQKAEWFEKQINAANKQHAYEKPAVLSVQIRQQKQSLESTCGPILSKPKPKVEPPKEEDKEAASDERKEEPQEAAMPDKDAVAEEETPETAKKVKGKDEDMDID